MRRVHINNKVWQYRVGKQNIVIQPPEEDGKKFYVGLSKLTGLSPDEIERGQWKRWFKVTPAQVKRYIKMIVLPHQADS